MRTEIEYAISRFPKLAHRQVVSTKVAPGLSGAKLWKLITPQSHPSILPNATSNFCLRRWPVQHPSENQLSWIHQVLATCSLEMPSLLPTPFPTDDGKTYLRCGGFLWELSPWLTGSAGQPEGLVDARLTDLMTVLVRFHQTAARFERKIGRSTNIDSRLEQLQSLAEHAILTPFSFSNDGLIKPLGSPWGEDLVAIFDNLNVHGMELARRLRIGPIIFPAIEQLVEPSKLKWRWPTKLFLTPVIRDLRIDHIFFAGDQVSAIIDFGAMKLDHRSFDLARLLGSCFDIYSDLDTAAVQQLKWQQALTIYNLAAEQPLSPLEQWLAIWADQVAVLLGSWNWLDWLSGHRIEFADHHLVAIRVAFHRRRLDNLINAVTL